VKLLLAAAPIAAAVLFSVCAASKPCELGPKAIQELKGVDARHPKFHTPSLITVDPSGNVYLFDQRDYRILQFSPEGTFQRDWEVPGEELGPVSNRGSSWFLCAMAASDSFLYIASGGMTFQLFPDGSVAQWNCGASRNGLAVDKDGNLFVSTSSQRWPDFGPGITRESRKAPIIKQRLDVLPENERAGIWKLSSQGETLAHWDAPPWPITFGKNGILYAVEPDSGGAILRIAKGKAEVKTCRIGLEKTLPLRSLAVGPTGQLFVNDHKNVVEFDENGNVVRRWCDPGPEYDPIDSPGNLCVGAQGHLYVVDYFKSRVLKFDLGTP